MLSSFDDVLVILACICASLVLLWTLQRFWPSSQRRIQNDIIGWQVSVLGTTYAVIVGFMLYAVWTTFQSAEINAEYEANCLVNVYRVADGLPGAQRVQVQQLTREYANTVIDQEWPAMHRGEASFPAHAAVEKLWDVVMQAKPVSFAEQSSMNLALTEIASMSEHRRVRELESQSKLPSILWIVLASGRHHYDRICVPVWHRKFQASRFTSLLPYIAVVARACCDCRYRSPISGHRARLAPGI